MKTVKNILYSLIAAVIAAAAAGIIFICTAPDTVNASATVYFKGNTDENDITFATRSVSELRRILKSREFIRQLSSQCGVDEEILFLSMSVEKFELSEGAQIVISGLDDPSFAPIILGVTLNQMEKTSGTPSFGVVSYCDVSSEPKLPYARLAISVGIMGALVCFVILSLVTGRTNEYYRAQKAEDDSDKYYEAVYMQSVTKRILERITDLGYVQPSSPDGLDKSGHAAAVRKIISECKTRPYVLAVTAANHYVGKQDIPSDAKLTAYLSCAFAAEGKRTAVVECCLKNPALGKIFGKSSSYGLSDIAAGNCAIWDALVVDAREGVDIIAETKSYPVPMAVFASSGFGGIIKYLSSQYEVLLLHVPKAWECEEWGILYSCCTGLVLVTEGDEDPDNITLNGISGSPDGFVSICRIANDEKHEKDESPETVKKTRIR